MSCINIFHLFLKVKYCSMNGRLHPVFARFMEHDEEY